MSSEILKKPLLDPACKIREYTPGQVLLSLGHRGVLLTLDEDLAYDISKLSKATLLTHLEKNLEEKEFVYIKQELLENGLLLEDPEVVACYGLVAEYAAYRLIHYYRHYSHHIWKKNKTLQLLNSNEPHPSLAMGFLLETFFHVRGAKWTSVPVLGHAMSCNQRELLERFYLEERNHYKIIGKAFSSRNIDVTKLLQAPAGIESELLERFFHSCAHQGVAQFATALIIPEIDEVASPLGHNISMPAKTFEQMVNVHQAPVEIIQAFRFHGHEHEEGKHSQIPVQILKEEGTLTQEKFRQLLHIVHHMVDTYDLFLDGIYKRHYKTFKVQYELEELTYVQ